MIRRGDKVTFKPEWCDIGDEGVQFTAITDECNGRFDVVDPREAHLAIQPRQTVSASMVATVESSAQ